MLAEVLSVAALTLNPMAEPVLQPLTTLFTVRDFCEAYKQIATTDAEVELHARICEPDQIEE